MNTSNKKPILITGSHRSGSTWVGNMVALSSSVGYIHEPFNLHHGPGICKAKFEYWFQYICDKNESLYSDDLEDCLHFKYHLAEELNAVRSIKCSLRLLRDYFHFTKCRILMKRPLIKDPIAVFSAEWLAKRFNMDVVVLIRHPAAFAGSLKKAKWTHPFDHFIKQPLLMQHHLDKYRSEIDEYLKTDKDIVDQAILLWNLIHYMICKYREDHPNWIFITHETLSENPIEEFGNLYNRLGLNFSSDIQQKIKSFSFAHPRKEKSNSLKRDSKSNIWRWKTRLAVDEIIKIKENTHEIASKFYTEEDWIES
jgi:hypothetical protein